MNIPPPCGLSQQYSKACRFSFIAIGASGPALRAQESPRLRVLRTTTGGAGRSDCLLRRH